MSERLVAIIAIMRWRLAAIWACFFARLAFYCAMLPLWEGYDEWAHFAVIRQMAVHGDVLAPRDAPVSRDVEASFQFAPVPWEMRALKAPSVTQDDFWQLPAEARGAREAALLAMPAAWSGQNGSGAFTAYEALQPPLYYWLMAPVLRVLLGCTLATQVMVLRWIGVLLASLVVPLVFWVARMVFDRSTALGCAAVVAVMPGLALDVARVGNDGLAVVLFTLLTGLAVKIVRQRFNPKLAAALGVVLGLGLLSKAYFLTAVPALVLLWGYDWWRARGRRRAAVIHGLLTAAISLAIAGWWYARNLRTTGTLSGLSESAMLRGLDPVVMLRQAASLNWAKAIDAILLSHIYFGGWSSLTVRSWMYHVFYAVILLAAVGLLRQIRARETAPLLAVYLAFWIGQLYNVLLLYLSKGLPGSMGWYMYAVVGAQAVLTVAGLRRMLPERFAGAAVALGAALFAALDLYTVHAVAIPYYTGMIRHKAGGAVAALHAVDLRSVGASGALERLTAFKGTVLAEPVLLVLWIAYLASTLYLVWGAVRRKREHTQLHP